MTGRTDKKGLVCVILFFALIVGGLSFLAYTTSSFLTKSYECQSRCGVDMSVYWPDGNYSWHDDYCNCDVDFCVKKGWIGIIGGCEHLPPNGGLDDGK